MDDIYIFTPRTREMIEWAKSACEDSDIVEGRPWVIDGRPITQGEWNELANEVDRLIQQPLELDGWTFTKIGPCGPIARQWFDDAGNYHTLYENGAESILTAELLADDASDELPHGDGND